MQGGIHLFIRRFNPRAREGRDTAGVNVFTQLARFNPRAREGRDRLRVTQRLLAVVSIHAPARGATLICLI